MNSNNKKKNSFSIFKLFSIILFLIIMMLTGKSYLDYKYNNLISKFYNEFNNYDYSEAKTILNNKLLTLKKNKINNDLRNYFTDIINKTCSALSNKNINSNTALEILNEINSYNVFDSSLDTLINEITNLDNNSIAYSNDENNTSSEDNYNNDISNNIDNTDADIDNYLNLGISAFNDSNYNLALDYFILIPESSTENYEIAKEYIMDLKENYSNYLFESVDELVANKYYTKAIDTLTNSKKEYLSEDDLIKIENKINSITMFKEEYQGDDSEYTSNAILTEIYPSNINDLSISSKTSHLIYVNLSKQITYIYEGENNNWSLVKEFNSSTGIEGQETPKGIFSVTNKGDWFFSEEFQQGGKYWVQFMGDYLFHSLPFDESQKNIVDDTLGIPSSHGCIRLSVEDAKWLYDNIDLDTKIIIN